MPSQETGKSSLADKYVSVYSIASGNKSAREAEKVLQGSDFDSMGEWRDRDDVEKGIRAVLDWPAKLVDLLLVYARSKGNDKTAWRTLSMALAGDWVFEKWLRRHSTVAGKRKVNPWAVCFRHIDKKKDPEKYENCVLDVKKQQGMR